MRRTSGWPPETLRVRCTYRLPAGAAAPRRAPGPQPSKSEYDAPRRAASARIRCRGTAAPLAWLRARDWCQCAALLPRVGLVAAREERRHVVASDVLRGGGRNSPRGEGLCGGPAAVLAVAEPPPPPPHTPPPPLPHTHPIRSLSRQLPQFEGAARQSESETPVSTQLRRATHRHLPRLGRLLHMHMGKKTKVSDVPPLSPSVSSSTPYLSRLSPFTSSPLSFQACTRI